MQLEPCPFCGETNAVICPTFYYPESKEVYAVACRTQDCHGCIFELGSGLFQTPDEAIAAWNTRTPADPVPNTETAAAMRDIQSGNVTRFDNVNDLMADLNDADPVITEAMMTDEELIHQLRGLETYGYQSQLACEAAARIEALIATLRRPAITEAMVEAGAKICAETLTARQGEPVTIRDRTVARAVLTAALGGDND